MKFVLLDSATTNAHAEARNEATRRNGHLRAPHHMASLIGLMGELAIAAGGVLMLDDIGEFRREGLRVLANHIASMHSTSRPCVVATYRGEDAKGAALRNAEVFARCHECGLLMSGAECGDELPEERVCDACTARSAAFEASMHFALDERAIILDALMFWGSEQQARAAANRASGREGEAARCTDVWNRAMKLADRITTTGA